MKKIVVLFLFCFSFTTASAHLGHSEVIPKFTADYTIAPDASVTVVETIDYDFSDEERHGIVRKINNKHPQPASVWYKKRSIDLTVESVTRDGISEPFVVSKTGSATEIKIGRENELLTSDHTYVITYTLIGALSYGQNGAEFYYNVTGNDWEVLINVASATVHSEALSGQFKCYQGTVGAPDTCTNSMKSGTGVTFTGNYLAVGEGLTIATELDASKVATVVHEEVTWLLFGIGLAAVWVVGVIVLVYRFRRSAYTPTPVIAQYEPYKDFLPMYTGYLVDSQLDPRDITAGIIYLAEQGFIKLTRTSKQVMYFVKVTDYEITLKLPLTDIPTKFLQSLSELLFPTGTAVGTTVTLSSLATERAKNAERILYLKRDLELDLKARGFLTSTVHNAKQIIVRTFGLMLVIFGGFILVPNGFIIVGVVIVATVVAGLVMSVSRRTELGYEAKNHLEGFKLFLSVTDKERFDFHNAPEKSPELFMQYLPYAVALGVEEKWAKVFEGITIPQPDWYGGGNIAAFSAGTLTNDLGAFSTALAANSGVSGSSGGGSSGGGGGGGGGGSG